MGRIALRQAGTFQQFFPIKMDIPRFYPGFPRSFSAGKALFHVSFASFPQRMLKTAWKLLKTVCFSTEKVIAQHNRTQSKKHLHIRLSSQKIYEFLLQMLFSLAGSPSQAHIRSPAPPKWEPLAVHANFISLPRALPLRKDFPRAGGRWRVSDKRGNLAKPTGFD